MASVVTIFYEDGSEDEVALKALDLVKAERHFKGALPSIEGTLYAAWKKLRPGVSFDSWLETVERMDNRSDDEENDAKGPLPAAPSPED